MRLDNDVMTVLAAAEVSGAELRLTGQLDRKLYVKVAKAIETAGGKWNRKTGAHVFSADAAAVVAQMLGAGSVTSEKTQQQFFETPAEVVAMLFAAAALEPWHEVLEPSAGRGAIASRLAPLVAAVDCIEQHGPHADVIRSAGYARSVRTADFLEVAPEPAYDRIVMNPPFTRGADVAHVMHAAEFLRPGGVLVSVMAAGVTYRTDAATIALREIAARLDPLPPKAFAGSGTDVSAVIAVIRKAAEVTAEPEQLDLFDVA